ncbi:MAG: hypothetical protein AAFQ84_11175 [Pseudomonadota bacterium]
MYAKLLPFELNLQMRQIGFLITAGLLLVLGFLIMSTDFIQVSGGGGERVKANGAMTVAALVSNFSIFSIFFGAIYVVSGLMRDETSKSLEIIHATPVPTNDMVLARMTGVIAATFLSLFALVVGLFAGQFAPWIDQETLGPINPVYFLYPAGIFLLVNSIIVSAFFTLIAATTRNRTLVYVSAVGLFILYFGANLFVTQDGSDLVVSMVDPFGANALYFIPEFWPADEQNTRLAPLLGLIGLNRLVWLGLAIATLALCFVLSRRGLDQGVSKRGPTEASDPRESVQVPALNAPLRFGPIPSLLRRTAFEFSATVRSISFMILTGLAVALFAIVIYVQAEFAPDPVLPNNVNMAQSVILWCRSRHMISPEKKIRMSRSGRKALPSADCAILILFGKTGSGANSAWT